MNKDDDSLSRYRQKRDFSITPEPSEAGRSTPGRAQFVIQKHWATQLHYDLRLEIDGAMKSWAVPKGPSLDPADKRMAVQVEDHPMSYNRFEGVIPAGQYGAGRVIVWDRGTWEPDGDALEGWRKGRLHFTLQGHKLQGGWALVRMGKSKAGSAKPTWLLIKEKDEYARTAAEFSVVEAQPDSVVTLAAPQQPAQAKVPSSARPSRKRPTPAVPLPPQVGPQLATLAAAAPEPAQDWLYELKFDGYRILGRIEGKEARLLTRNGKHWTHKLPHLAQALKALPADGTWLDGEVVALGPRGRPDFQTLQNAFDRTAEPGKLAYCVFDLLFADGADLRSQPLEARRARLEKLLEANTSPLLQLSQTLPAKRDLLAWACKQGFEGVIGKRKGSPYTAGRTGDWIKLKCGLRQEFVVGGYTPPKGSRTVLGSLLLGFYDEEGRLHYAGNVGTGFTVDTLRALEGALVSRRSKSSPFAPGSRPPTQAVWVRPELVAEVAFAEWTQGHRIRQGVFKGLRSDKPAGDIRREQPAAPASRKKGAGTSPSPPPTPARSERAASVNSAAEPRITHGERVIDPSTGLTKADLVRYYALVASLMLPHLAGRPVALVRAPEGVGGELFFQKHQEGEALAGMRLLDPALDEGHAPLLEVVNAQGLRSGSQMNVVEYHTWNALKDRIDRPDRMTFDLDPGEGVAWEQVQEGARLVRVLLQELGLPAFLKTSGGKGLHVVVPLKRLRSWEAVKDFSQAIVAHLARTIPERFVAKSGPRNRVGKIFVDYLRNGRGATTVSAWSARARPGMGVSVPLEWSELETLSSATHWNVRNIEGRLGVGNAPWEGYGHAAVGLAEPMKALGFRPK